MSDAENQPILDNSKNCNDNEHDMCDIKICLTEEDDIEAFLMDVKKEPLEEESCDAEYMTLSDNICIDELDIKAECEKVSKMCIEKPRKAKMKSSKTYKKKINESEKCDNGSPLKVFKGNKITQDCTQQFICLICKKSFKKRSGLLAHQPLHSGIKPFECEVCSKTFFASSNLILHIRSHTGEKPYECDLCAKKFNHSSHMKQHRLIHNGEKHFECDVCKRKFTRKSHMKRHKQTHQKLECNICIKNFSDLKSYNSHIKLLHGDSIKFRCDICTRKYFNLSSLNTHKRSVHHNNKPFKCDICNKGFIILSLLNKHITAMHCRVEKTFECNICMKKFRTPPYLKRHKKDIHKIFC